MNNGTFVPDMENMGGITPSLWRYTPILPLVFGMELSYMEQVAKLTHKINEIINSDNAQASNIEKLYQAFAELEAAALGKGEGWITTAMLADSSVTSEKLANAAVVGEHLADAIVTTKKLVDGCITTNKLGEHVVEKWNIAVGAVGASEIAGRAIHETNIGDKQITTRTINDLAVTGEKIAKNSIDREHLSPGSVGSSQIGGRAVIEDNIGDGAVVNRAIADGAITVGKLTPEMANAWNLLVQTMEELLQEHGVFGFYEIRLSQRLETAPTAQVTFNGAIIHDLGDPVDPQDGVNKRYVDKLVNGSQDVFEGYDRFYHSISTMRVNPDSPLVIPTYDGSGHATHPCVRHYDWCGHKFWMGYTPYPMSNLELENPCLGYSDNGYDWNADGIPNPLDLPVYVNGEQASMNSDVHLVPVGNTLEVWWRTNYWSNNPDGEYMTVSRRTSTDGVNWSAKEELFRVNPGDGFGCVCPVALYEDGIYKIWFVDPFKGVRYYESTTGKNWQYIRQIDVGNLISPEHKVWHFDIVHTHKGYEFVGCYRPENDDHGNAYVFYAHSDDNISYSERTLILTPGKEGSFDNLQLYRPSFVRLPNEVRVYYGAQDSTLQWNIGVITAPNPYLFNAVLETGKRYDNLKNRVSVLESAKGSPVAAGTTIVESFEVSPWVSGYWKPEANGEMTIYGNFHHTQLVPLANLMVDGQLPEITAINNVAIYPVLRVNYFDGNMRWIGFDTATADPTQSGKQEPTPIRWYTGAVYVAISANSADKSTIVVTSS